MKIEQIFENFKKIYLLYICIINKYVNDFKVSLL